MAGTSTGVPIGSVGATTRWMAAPAASPILVGTSN